MGSIFFLGGAIIGQLDIHTQTDAHACRHARTQTHPRAHTKTHQSQLENETHTSHYLFNLMVINSTDTSICGDENNLFLRENFFFGQTETSSLKCSWANVSVAEKWGLTGIYIELI